MPPFPPKVPEPTGVTFPDPNGVDRQLIAVGSDFRPGTLLAAYREGIFPWPHSIRHVPWCSPDPRMVLNLERDLKWSRSLRRTLRKHDFEVTLDDNFSQTIGSCRDTRESTWIFPGLVTGFHALYQLGFAHSVEVWSSSRKGRQLVGGIYGLSVGRVFVGESMFHIRTDASKIAFATLAHSLKASGFVMLDAQVHSSHLASLGCVEIPRKEYLARLREHRDDQRRIELRLPERE
jgi:leucyl/phenylalanyl-tRNA--protein transferase